MPTPNNAVLLAVSPNQKAIEVVYGAELQGRGIEESAPLGVKAAAASFNYGNLIDGPRQRHQGDERRRLARLIRLLISASVPCLRVAISPIEFELCERERSRVRGLGDVEGSGPQRALDACAALEHQPPQRRRQLAGQEPLGGVQARPG